MKKTTLMSLVAISVAALFSGSAMAADAGQFYAGASVGSDTTHYTGGATTTATSATSVGVLGGYQITSNLAAEVAYADLGDKMIGTTKLKTTGWNASLVGILPVTGKWSAYGKVGYGSLKTATNAVPDVGAKHGSALVGFGAQYKIDDHYTVRGGVETQKSGVLNGNTSSENNYMLTGIYSFN